MTIKNGAYCGAFGEDLPSKPYNLIMLGFVRFLTSSTIISGIQRARSTLCTPIYRPVKGMCSNSLFHPLVGDLTYYI